MIPQEKIIKVCQYTTRWSVYSIIFLIPIYFAWIQENFSVFDLNKSVILHILYAIGIMTWLIEIMLSGKIVWQGNRWLVLGASLLGTLFLISTIFSIHPLLSLWGSYERWQGLYNLWHYIGFALLIAISLRSKKDIHSFIKALLFGSALSSLYGLIQFLGLDPLRWGEDTDRLFSSFGQPNFFGHYLAVVLPFTLYAGWQIAKTIYVRLAYCLLASLQLFCLIFTYSRAAWLALFSTGLLLLLWLVFKQGKKSFFRIGGIIFICIICIFIFIPKSDYKIQERVSSIFSTDKGSNRMRLLYWQAGLETWTKSSVLRKVIGYGPDTQATLYVSTYRPTWAYDEQINSFPDRAHNFILDILFQFGLLGLVVITSLVSHIFWKLYKSIILKRDNDDYWLAITLLSALCIYGINNLFSFSLVAMNVVWYGLLGISWVVAHHYQTQEISLKFFQPLSRKIITGVFCVFLLILIYHYNIRLYIADYYFYESRKASAQKDCSVLLDRMDKTVAWYPLSQYYNRQYISSGTNCFSATDPSSYQQLGKALLAQAVNIQEKEYQFHTLIELSHMYSIMGFYVNSNYYEEAEKLYIKMLDINPFITSTYQDYGRLKLWQGKNDEAIAIFQKGISVLPTLDVNHIIYHRQGIVRQLAYFNLLIGSAYSDKKEPDKAIDFFQRVLQVDPTYVGAYLNLADTYHQLGDLKKAIEYNEKALRIDRNNSTWSFNLATLYKEQGNITTAKKYAEQALDQSPEDEKIKKLVEELKTE